MNICILTHTFPRFNGDVAAPFMDGVAKGIKSAKNKVYVLTPYSSSFKNFNRGYKLKLYKYIFPDNLHKLGYSETLSDDKQMRLMAKLLSPFLIVFGIISLYLLVKKEKIEVINAHWILPNGFIASIVSAFTGVKVVSTLPGSDVLMAFKNPLFSKMTEFAISKSSIVTSNSAQLLEDLSPLGLDDSKKKTIIYGVDPKKFIPDKSKSNLLKKKYGIPPKAVVVVSVGRLVEKKGFKYLIAAAKRVIKKNGSVYFVLVGDGDQQDQLLNQVKTNKLDKNFIFAGSINYDELKDYYNLADIFVLPSIRDREGNLDDQSVAVVEAMSCGVPSITTDFPGYKLVINDGKNGFLFKEKDTEALTAILLKLIANKELRKIIGFEARRDSVRKYSWNAIGQEYSKLFKSL